MVRPVPMLAPHSSVNRAPVKRFRGPGFKSLSCLSLFISYVTMIRNVHFHVLSVYLLFNHFIYLYVITFCVQEELKFESSSL